MKVRNQSVLKATEDVSLMQVFQGTCVLPASTGYCFKVRWTNKGEEIPMRQRKGNKDYRLSTKVTNLAIVAVWLDGSV